MAPSRAPLQRALEPAHSSTLRQHVRKPPARPHNVQDADADANKLETHCSSCKVHGLAQRSRTTSSSGKHIAWHANAQRNKMQRRDRQLTARSLSPR
eukprot:3828242-Rhodomonas_salina.1